MRIRRVTSLLWVSLWAFPWDPPTLDYDHCHYSCGLSEYLRTLFKDFMEIGTSNFNCPLVLPLALVLDAWWREKLDELDQHLFGSTLTITDEQVIALFVIAFVVLVLTALFLCLCIF